MITAKHIALLCGSACLKVGKSIFAIKAVDASPWINYAFWDTRILFAQQKRGP